MTTPHRIVLTLSPELFGQLEARAAEGRIAAREWARRALLAALTRPESRKARERRSREAGFALLSLLARSTGSGPAGHPSGERGSHAANP